MVVLALLLENQLLYEPIVTHPDSFAELSPFFRVLLNFPHQLLKCR